jgi:cytochrome c-type biogenesis protein CcmH/NrfG
MNQLSLILIIIIVLAVIYIYVTRFGKKQGKRGALWQDIRRQLRLPPKLADETIERHITRLKKHHPNRSEEWYLEKIIYDLERDRS